MIIQYKKNYDASLPIETELTAWDLKKSLQKTREALEIAYTGFDNAVDFPLIDSYIYEINALQTRYEYLSEIAAQKEEMKDRTSNQHSTIRTLISHVFRQVPSSIS